MKKILFIYPGPNEKKDSRFSFSLNIAYASSILKENGWQTCFLDLSCQKLSDLEVLNYISTNEIAIVAVEFDSFSLKRSENSLGGNILLKQIKQKFPEVGTVAFGNYCILKKDKIPYADITITTDVSGGILSATENLWEKKFCYEDVPYDYDDLPFPDRGLIENIPFYAAEPKSTLIQTSYGCLNTCAFCQRQGWNNGRKEHSIEYVLREFSLLKQQNYKNVWIVDENFAFNMTRAKRLLYEFAQRGITEGMKIFISCWAKIDKDFLTLAKEANVSIISMGVESANPESMHFYKKEVDVEHVRELILHAHKLGIYIAGNFIIGAPAEGEEEIQKTFELIDELSPDQVNIHTLDYMIGSEIYQSLDREKYKDTHYFSCLETGLGKLPQKRLAELKADYLEHFSEESKLRLRKKVQMYGPPYWV